MKRCTTNGRAIWVGVGILAGLLLPGAHPSARAAGNPNPRVLPPVSHPLGLTYGEWSARWWKWAFTIPPAVNPILDSTGEDIAVGQSGNVWFLAGTSGGQAHRVGTLPTGKALFFPLINSFYDNSRACTGLSQADWVNSPGYATVAQMQAAIKQFIDGVGGMACEVDGAPIQGIGSGATSPYRAASPPFGFFVPRDSLYASGTCSDAPDYIGIGANPGEAAVSDGVYLMLAPLSAGHHTIHWVVPGFLEVTYDLTVRNS